MRKIMMFIAVVALLLPTVLLAQAHQSGWRESGHPYTTSELMIVPQQELPALTQEESEQVSAQIYYSLNQWATTGDPGWYIANLEPDVRFIRLGDATDVFGTDKTVASISEILDMATEVGFNITKVEVYGRYVISTGIMTGIHIGTNGQLAVPFVDAILVGETGMVSAIIDGTDFPTLAEQIYIAYMYNVCACEDIMAPIGDVTVETEAVTHMLISSRVSAWSWGAVKNMGK